MNTVDTGLGRLAAATLAILAGAATVGAIAAVTGHNEDTRPGDLPVTIRDFAFDPSRPRGPGR